MDPLKRTMMILAVIAVAIAAVLAAAVLLGGPSNGGNSNDQQIDDMTFTGRGDNVTANFDLAPGISIYRMTHDGDGDFWVTLYNDTGGLNSLLVNTVGPFAGSQLVGAVEGQLMGAEPGPHNLHVRADGNWTITVQQPRVLSPSSLPLTINGQGANVSIPITLPSGMVKVDLVNTNAASATSDFVVMMYDNNGAYVALLANEWSNYTGSKTLTVDGGLFDPSPGTHWINIDADGDWTITLTKV